MYKKFKYFLCCHNGIRIADLLKQGERQNDPCQFAKQWPKFMTMSTLETTKVQKSKHLTQMAI